MAAHNNRVNPLVRRAIKRAESLLPGTPAPEGKNDRRWQAITRIGDYIKSNPEEVWQFVRRWGTHKQTDFVTQSPAVCWSTWSNSTLI